MAVLAAAPEPARATAPCAAESGDRVVPLVELYTSEGCSSCPPADRWLSRKLALDDTNWLAFHVDYWDDIGWPDRFASARYSQRQRARVGAAGDSVVYTPQVMIGTNVRGAWQNDAAFDSALDASRGRADARLGLRLQPHAGDLRIELNASLSDSGTAPAQVWLALYVDGQTSKVNAGENRGSTLQHDRVVQELWGPWPVDAKASTHAQELPRRSGEWGIVAFVQDARGATLQSLALPASRCAVPPLG